MAIRRLDSDLLKGIILAQCSRRRAFVYILWFLDAKLNDRRYLDRTLNESLPHEHLSDIHDYIEFENSFHLRLIILILISFLTLCLKSV